MGGLRRSVHVGKEPARFLLIARSVHMVEASVVVINVGVTTASIDVVAQVSMVLHEVVASCLTHVRGHAIEMTAARLVLVHSKHLGLWMLFAIF